jgi:hypothetical protein
MMNKLSTKQLAIEIKKYKTGKGESNSIKKSELLCHMISHYCMNNPNEKFKIPDLLTCKVGNIPKKFKMLKTSYSTLTRVSNLLKENQQNLSVELSRDGRSKAIQYNPNPSPVSKTERKYTKQTTSPASSFDRFEPILERILKKFNRPFKEREIIILESKLEWLKSS